MKYYYESYMSERKQKTYTERGPSKRYKNKVLIDKTNRTYINSWSAPTRLAKALALTLLEPFCGLRGKLRSRKKFHRPITGPDV